MMDWLVLLIASPYVNCLFTLLFLGKQQLNVSTRVLFVFQYLTLV